MTWAPILWLLLFLPALIALYFLKLKRQDVVISSTLLWKRSLEDLHVNAPFQKMRKSWLLLLQLVILMALIAASWRLRSSGDPMSGSNLIVLIDNSASTATYEVQGQRLDLAKSEALKLISSMDEEDRATLLVFSSKTTTLEPLTGNKSLLASRVRSIQSVALPTDLDQALVVAHSLAATLPDSAVHVFGDGCYGDLSSLPPEAKRMSVEFVSRSTRLGNMAITEADVRRTFEAESKVEVFALVENFSDAPSQTIASLYLEGDLKDARLLDVPAGGAASVVFDATDMGEGVARVAIDADEGLAVDNEAWVEIAPVRKVKVLVVGRSNPWIDFVLASATSMTHRRMSEEEFLRLNLTLQPDELKEGLDADVLLLDRVSIFNEGVEKRLATPPLPAIFIGCHPSLADGPQPVDEAQAPAKVANLPTVVDWDRGHPVNRFLVFLDLFIEKSIVFSPSKEYRSLVDSDAGSLIGVRRFYRSGHPSVPAVLVGFDVMETNWPVRHHSFPIFFSNAISWLGSGVEGRRGACTRAGEPLIYDPSEIESEVDVASIRFRSPSGQLLIPSLERSGSLILGAAEEAGVYEVVAGGEVLERLPVALLNASESRLEPSKSVDFGDYQVEVQAAVGTVGKDLWKWFALAALAFLLLEWHVYNRRLAG